MKSNVIYAIQSPLNKKQWSCELECGHTKWVTSRREPRVVECSKDHPVDPPSKHDDSRKSDNHPKKQ